MSDRSTKRAERKDRRWADRKPIPLTQYSDAQAMDAALTSPTAVAMFRVLPGPAATGCPRDYPEPAYLAMELLKPVYGSTAKVEANIADQDGWGRFCRSLCTALPNDTRLKEMHKLPPIRKYHHRHAANTWLKEARAEIHAAGRAAAQQLAQDLGQCVGPGPGSNARQLLENQVKYDGHVMKPLHVPHEVIDNRTGEVIRTVAGDPDAENFKTGDGWKHGLEFLYGLTAGNGRPWSQVVVDLAWVPHHGQEVATAETCIAATARSMPGMTGILYDAALAGVTINRWASDLGLCVISPVTAEEAAKPGKPRVEKSKRLRTFTHQRDGKACNHELYYHGGKVVELGRLTGDGNRPVRELAYVGPRCKINQAEIDRREAEAGGELCDRRARRGGRSVAAFTWRTSYKLTCGDETFEIAERSTTIPELDRKFNRSENVRQIPPGTPLYDELYPHRSSIEGFNSWMDGRFWLRRARSKGAERQFLEQIGLINLYNSLVWRANRHLLEPPGELAA